MQITGQAIPEGGHQGAGSSGGSDLHGLAGHTQGEKSGGPGQGSVSVAGRAGKSLQRQHTDVRLRLMTRVTMEGRTPGRHRWTPP